MAKQKLKLGSAHRVGFSPNGKNLATLSMKLTVWDVSSGTRLFSDRPLSNLSEFAYSPNGKMILLKNTAGELVLVDSRSGQLIRRLDRPATPGVDGHRPLFSPCGRYVIDTTWRGLLTAYSVRSGRSKFAKQFANEKIDGLAFLPSGESAYSVIRPDPLNVSEEEEELATQPYLNSWKWPFWEFEPKRREKCMHGSAELICSKAGKHFACLQDYFGVCIYLIRGRKQIHCIDYEESVRGIQWSANGQWLAVAVGDTIDLRHAKDFAKAQVYDYPGASGFAFSPDGKRVAIAAGSKSFMTNLDDFRS